MPGSSRGTLFPERLPEFHRVEPSPDAALLVRWYWVSRWNLPDGEVSRQSLIGFPALNLVVEDGFVGLAGATTRADYSDLTGAGWVVAALLRPAAVPSLTADPGALLDQYQRFEAPELHAAVTTAMVEPSEAGRAAATAALGSWLALRVGEPGPDALLANRLAELAEDPEVQRIGDLAARLSVSERTLQRLARTHIGLSPAVLIRRRRLQEAAERIRADPDADLAALAVDLGYADQAHLTNEFARVLGFSPGSYRRAVSG